MIGSVIICEQPDVNVFFEFLQNGADSLTFCQLNIIIYPSDLPNNDLKDQIEEDIFDTDEETEESEFVSAARNFFEEYPQLGEALVDTACSVADKLDNFMNSVIEGVEAMFDRIGAEE